MTVNALRANLDRLSADADVMIISDFEGNLLSFFPDSSTALPVNLDRLSAEADVLIIPTLTEICSFFPDSLAFVTYFMSHPSSRRRVTRTLLSPSFMMIGAVLNATYCCRWFSP